MKSGIQTFYAEVGEAACYAFCIVDIAIEVLHTALEEIHCILQGIAVGYIYYNWNDPEDSKNFFVEHPEKFLGMLTGLEWSVEKTGPDYVLKEGEYAVERWERVVTGATLGHFNREHFDPLLSSKCVKYGKKVSRRIFRRRK